mmetsp:Transcript_13512/g.43288  ORF Transcript_13512/g.43288 Transcript_13512/m.43288 type:complete len:220 (-) Transcript_13512:1250-1909(-)
MGHPASVRERQRHQRPFCPPVPAPRLRGPTGCTEAFQGKAVSDAVSAASGAAPSAMPARVSRPRSPPAVSGGEGGASCPGTPQGRRGREGGRGGGRGHGTVAAPGRQARARRLEPGARRRAAQTPPATVASETLTLGFATTACFLVRATARAAAPKTKPVTPSPRPAFAKAAVWSSSPSLSSSCFWRAPIWALASSSSSEVAKVSGSTSSIASRICFRS